MKRGGRIIAWLTERMGGLRRLFAQSAMFSWLGGCASRMEEDYRSGLFEGLSDRECGRDAWQYRRRRAFMHAFEKSAVFRFFQALGNALMTATVGSYGVFAFVWGTFTAAIAFATHRTSYPTLVFSVGLLFLSVLILRSDKSMQSVVESSLLLGGLVYGLCKLPHGSPPTDEKGIDRAWQAGGLAVLMALLGRWISPVRLLFAVLLCVLGIPPLLIPELGGCMLLLALPFFNLLPHPTVVLLSFAVLLFLSWGGRLLCGRRRMRFGAIDFCVLLLALQYLASGSVQNGGKASFFAGASTAIAILLWFPTVNLFFEREWRQRATVALCLSSFITSAVGILQYVLGKSELRWVDVERFSDIGGRVTSFFDNPNVLAVFLLLTVPLSWNLMSRENASVLGRWLGYACFLSGSVCLVLTWSRGAWLAILFAIFSCLLLYSKESMAGLLVLALPLSASVGYLPHAVRNRFASISSLTETSIRYRLYTWKGVLQMLAEHPFGIGAGRSAFSNVYPSYAVSGTETVVHAHNLLLRIACELGVVGCITFLFLLLFFVLLLIEKLQTEPKGSTRLATLSCFCALAAGLIMGFFDDIWYHLGLNALFFIVCALFTNTDERKGERRYGI